MPYATSVIGRVPRRRVPAARLPRRRRAERATTPGVARRRLAAQRAPSLRATCSARRWGRGPSSGASRDRPCGTRPRRSREKFPDERWEFVGYRDDDETRPMQPIAGQETHADEGGRIAARAADHGERRACRGRTRSKATSRTSRGSTSPTAPASTVHPAHWYVGVRRPPYFVEQKNGLKTEIVAVGLDGTPVAGVPVERDADADPVEERAPRRRQRLLHVGHREKEIPVGIVDGDDGRRSRCRSRSRCRPAATSC